MPGDTKTRGIQSVEHFSSTKSGSRIDISKSMPNAALFILNMSFIHNFPSKPTHPVYNLIRPTL
jgi:hypothetical protein